MTTIICFDVSMLHQRFKKPTRTSEKDFDKLKYRKINSKFFNSQEKYFQSQARMLSSRQIRF
ncbi:hypothetical protein SynRS9902_00213 [Synechococcus sp. RS9902]|nr:hypothetical protein SynRS9902_00213 [Synechococcus sp. RS9902]